MEKGRFFYRSAKLAGFLLLVFAILHAALGTAEVLSAIKVGGLMPSMVTTIKNIQAISCVALFLSAIWVLFLAGDLGRLQRRAWWQGVLIGIGYVGGSIGAMIWAGIQVQVVAFLLVGLILLLPLLAGARAFTSAP